MTIYDRETQHYSGDSLDWWKLNGERFPSLAKVARKVLAVPATSCPCERVFKRSSTTFRDRRVLESGNAVSQILLAVNGPLIQKHGWIPGFGMGGELGEVSEEEECMNVMEVLEPGSGFGRGSYCDNNGCDLSEESYCDPYCLESNDCRCKSCKRLAKEAAALGSGEVVIEY